MLEVSSFVRWIFSISVRVFVFRYSKNLRYFCSRLNSFSIALKSGIIPVLSRSFIMYAIEIRSGFFVFER